MKKVSMIICTLVASLFITFNSAHADGNINIYKDKDTILVTDKTGKAISSIDTSEATFLDENGKQVEGPDLRNYFVSVKTSVDGKKEISYTDFSKMTRGYDGGSWAGGSGYRACRGLRVYSDYGGNISFKADFELVQGAPDRINRVYNWQFGYYYGSVSVIQKGIMRQVESLNGPAYAGATYNLNSNPGGASTDHLYLAVSHDGFRVLNYEP